MNNKSIKKQYNKKREYYLIYSQSHSILGQMN